MAPPRKGLTKLQEKRADRHSDREKNFPNDNFELVIPSHYEDETKIELVRQFQYQKDSGILSSSDLASLMLAFNIYNEATKIYKQLLEVSIVEDDTKYKKYFDMYSSAVTKFNTLIRQFGVTPTERTKVTELVVDKKDKTKNITNVLTSL